MNNFWTLVGFEFQKMRKRRVVIPALFACLGVVAVMAWTTLYDHLEKCCDRCEDVADVVERVIMKNT